MLRPYHPPIGSLLGRRTLRPLRLPALPQLCGLIVATVLAVSHTYVVGAGSVKLLVLDASGHTEKEVSLDEARMEVARAILDGRAIIGVDSATDVGTPLTDPGQLSEKHKLAYILHPMAGG